jgi:hypothetical protein
MSMHCRFKKTIPHETAASQMGLGAFVGNLYLKRQDVNHVASDVGKFSYT